MTFPWTRHKNILIHPKPTGDWKNVRKIKIIFELGEMKSSWSKYGMQEEGKTKSRRQSASEKSTPRNTSPQGEGRTCVGDASCAGNLVNRFGGKKKNKGRVRTHWISCTSMKCSFNGQKKGEEA